MSIVYIDCNEKSHNHYKYNDIILIKNHTSNPQQYYNILNKLYILGIQFIVLYNNNDDNNIDYETIIEQINDAELSANIANATSIGISTKNSNNYLKNKSMDTVEISGSKFQKTMKKEATKLIYAEKKEKYKKEIRQNSSLSLSSKTKKLKFSKKCPLKSNNTMAGIISKFEHQTPTLQNQT